VPPVAELVLVEEPPVTAELDLGETDLACLGGERGTSHMAEAEVRAVDAVPMELRIIPAEGDLEGIVEIGEGALTAEQKAPPDHRADPADPDVEVVDRRSDVTCLDPGQDNQAEARCSASGFFHSRDQRIK
jgi:hypothetical protein